MGSLQDKVVFITGSSIGIGRETALLFAKEGAKVIITYYKDKKEAERVEREAKRLGAADSLILQLNVLDDKSIKACVRKTIDSFSEISILINNAGVYLPAPLEKQTIKEIELQIRINFEGLVKITKGSLSYIKDKIINIGSGAALEGNGGMATYSATKFAVRGFTQSIAEERRDLGVYIVNPHATATRMTGFTGTPPEKVAEVIVNVAKDEYKVPSGSDVNVWDYV